MEEDAPPSPGAALSELLPGAVDIPVSALESSGDDRRSLVLTSNNLRCCGELGP